jgi:hypothetical protein
MAPVAQLHGQPENVRQTSNCPLRICRCVCRQQPRTQSSAFIHITHARPFDCADMHEYVGAPGVRLDKSKALRRIEPFHCADRHNALLLNGREPSRTSIHCKARTRRFASGTVVTSGRSRGLRSRKSGRRSKTPKNAARHQTYSRPCARSEIKSSTFSMPIETRISASDKPISSRNSRATPECVIEAGCDINVSVPPKLTASFMI